MARVLVVDDNKEVCASLEAVLTELGHETSVVHEGKDCLEYLNQSDYDLVFLDLIIPNVSGLEILTKIRTESRNPKIPIIAAIEPTSREDIAHTFNLEVLALFAKPFSLDLFREKIQGIDSSAKRQKTYDPWTIRIFLESTINVFSSFAHMDLIAGKPFLKNGNKSLSEFSGVIKFSHNTFAGNMVVMLDSDLLKSCLTNILSGVNQIELDEAALKDCCGEISNQILGRAKQAFIKEKNHGFDVSIPVVLFGKDHVLNYKNQNSVLVIPFNYEEQVMYVEFSISENDAVDTKESSAKIKPNSETSVIEYQEGDVILF